MFDAALIKDCYDEEMTACTIYEYDEKEKLAKMYFDDPYDKLIEITTYKYDEKEKLIKECFEDSKGKKSVTTYEYDEEGRLVREYFYNVD